LEVALDAVHIDQHVVELLQQKEAARHALPTWNRIALSSRSSN
jgi:hypothetical protein